MGEESESLEPEIVPPPQLSHADLLLRANGFLDRYHPARAVPIPIEQIVEFDLGLNIVPVPGLHRDTGLDGFISSDLMEITVDQERMERYEGRYHFTLAHEVAHKVLHKTLYNQFAFSTIDEWKQFVEDIGENLHDRLEREADEFAGLILVPKEPLHQKLQENLQKAERLGIQITIISDQLNEYLADYLAREFEVSGQVIKIRLQREKWFGHRRR